MSPNPAETALATLREHCSPEQADALAARQDFEVVGASGTRYRVTVREGTPVSVSWFSQRRAGPWIAQLKSRIGALPKADLALLAKLSIESSEAEWERAGLACGTVWVEDRCAMPQLRLVPGEPIVAQGTEQEVLAQWQQIVVAAQQLGLVPPGTIYQSVQGLRFQWNGRTWVALR